MTKFNKLYSFEYRGIKHVESDPQIIINYMVDLRNYKQRTLDDLNREIPELDQIIEDLQKEARSENERY